MRWIYLSPHLDDAVYSCGGMIASQVANGDQVEVWSIFAGDPLMPLSPFALSLHERWQTSADASEVRRREDLAACAILGVEARHFSLADCIYRRSEENGQPIITENDDLFAPIHPGEAHLVTSLAEELQVSLPAGAALVSPLTLGGHMDHRLVRAAAERLGMPMGYYSDFPYAAADSKDLDCVLPPDARETLIAVTPAALEKWQSAAAAYRSQISTFWKDISSLNESIYQYWKAGGGQKCGSAAN